MSENLKPIKVRIKNFQSIKDIEFEIKGFTCLVGVTNIGKSAIVRAISSSILNNSVIGMVRKGASHSTVSMECEDWAYTWEKGEKGINRYIIGGKTLDKVGAKQLDEIASFGFKPVNVGSDNIHPWLASQFSPIFLLDKPGSQVTDFISEVSRLNVLQDAITLCAKGKRKHNDESNARSEESKNLKGVLEKLTALEELNNIKQDLEDQFKSILDYSNSIELLDKFSKKVKSLETSIDHVKEIEKVILIDKVDFQEVDVWKSLSRIEENISKHASGIIPLNSIKKTKIPDEINEVSNYIELKNISKKIDRLKGDAYGPIKDIPEPVKSYSQYIELMALNVRLTNQANECVKSKKILKEIDADLLIVNQEIEKIPRCPTCDKPHLADNHTAN